MSDLYRAPEVLLKLPWAFPVDVWSVGVMTLELLEGRSLFDPIDREHDQYVLPLALSQYIGYLGPPPLEMIKRIPLFRTYFDEEGNWISEPPIPETSLENFITTVPPGEEREMLLKFIRKMLTWDPEVRATSSKILEDEWLMTPVDDIP
ncbi:Protein kinase domain-containing protein [Cladophialophora immunda]|nr:Protein kinase domain-containing protein [Cladophialophora immunda]